MKTIRNAARAVIIKDGKLLCIKYKDTRGEFYVLPGGGQQHGESIRDALKRECLEEVCAQVDIGDLLYLRDYIGKNHEFASFQSDLHQIEYVFECTILGNCEIKVGQEPDEKQIGIEWLEIASLNNHRLYPADIKEVIRRKEKTHKMYRGDVN